MNPHDLVRWARYCAWATSNGHQPLDFQAFALIFCAPKIHRYIWPQL